MLSPLRKLIILILLLGNLSPSAALAQSASNPTQMPGIVMPPMPEAASLVRSIDRPVNTYTGTPQIEIPLWSVQLKSLQMPIGLNYDASGVKVEQEASSVGLSWSLIAGGVITRAVKDIPDDYNKGSVIGRQQDRPFDASMSGEHPRLGRFWSGKYEALKNFDVSNTQASYVKPAITNIKANAPSFMLDGMNDLEPDVFYFSFGGKSGKFLFDVNGTTQNIVLLPYQDLKISHTINTAGEIISFTITDNDGTQYLFDKVERQHRIDVSEFRPVFPTGYDANGFPEYERTDVMVFTDFNASWFLSKVTTNNKEKINLFYADESYDQYDRPGSGGRIGKYNNGTVYNQNTNRSSGRTQSTTKKRLTKIETDKETINFYGNHQRQDLQLPSYAITTIEVKDRLSGSTLKSFDLDYSYFQSPTTEPFDGMNSGWGSISVSEQPPYYKRLKLNSVTEKASNGTSNSPHTFYYNETSPLPHRFSYKQDFWGYFNGASFNVGLFPKTYIYNALQGSDRFRVYPRCNQPLPDDSNIIDGANRIPNFNYLKIGSLNKIVYPTGGYTEYEFEANEFVYDGCEYEGGGQRIKLVRNYSPQYSSLSTAPATTTAYSYYNEQGNESSGRTISMPVFMLKTFVEYWFYNSSQAMLGTTSGSYVGYQRVTETIQGSINNGNTVYEYSIPATHNQATDPEYGLYNVSQVKWYDSDMWVNDPQYIAFRNNYHLVPNTMPFAPNPEYDWNRGKLLKKTYSNSAGQKLKEISNTYRIFDAPTWKGTKNIYGLCISTFWGCDFIGSCSAMTYSKYEMLTNRANVLESTTEKDYSYASGGQQVLTKTTHLSYANTGHMNPVEVTTNRSNGEERVEKSIYPHDYDAQTPLPYELLLMKNRNMSIYPIEQLVYLKNGNQKRLIKGTLTQYKLHGDLVLPGKVYEVETIAMIRATYGK